MDSAVLDIFENCDNILGHNTTTDNGVLGHFTGSNDLQTK